MTFHFEAHSNRLNRSSQSSARWKRTKKIPSKRKLISVLEAAFSLRFPEIAHSEWEINHEFVKINYFGSDGLEKVSPSRHVPIAQRNLRSSGC
jgi:hypothetical protein